MANLQESGLGRWGKTVKRSIAGLLIATGFPSPASSQENLSPPLQPPIPKPVIHEYLPGKAPSQQAVAALTEKEKPQETISPSSSRVILFVDKPYAIVSTPEREGRIITTDVPPQIVEGRTLVPIRMLGESLGAKVFWNNINSTATVERGGRTVSFQENEKVLNMTIDGKTQSASLDVPPQRIGGRMMGPLRATAESLGEKNILYDEESRTVWIGYPEGEKQKTEEAIGGSGEMQPAIKALFSTAGWEYQNALNPPFLALEDSSSHATIAFINGKDKMLEEQVKQEGKTFASQKELNEAYVEASGIRTINGLTENHTVFVSPEGSYIFFTNQQTKEQKVSFISKEGEKKNIEISGWVGAWGSVIRMHEGRLVLYDKLSSRITHTYDVSSNTVKFLDEFIFPGTPEERMKTFLKWLVNEDGNKLQINPDDIETLGGISFKVMRNKKGEPLFFVKTGGETGFQHENNVKAIEEAVKLGEELFGEEFLKILQRGGMRGYATKVSGFIDFKTNKDIMTAAMVIDAQRNLIVHNERGNISREEISMGAQLFLANMLIETFHMEFGSFLDGDVVKKTSFDFLTGTMRERYEVINVRPMVQSPTKKNGEMHGTMGGLYKGRKMMDLAEEYKNVLEQYKYGPTTRTLYDLYLRKGNDPINNYNVGL